MYWFIYDYFPHDNAGYDRLKQMLDSYDELNDKLQKHIEYKRKMYQYYIESKGENQNESV